MLDIKDIFHIWTLFTQDVLGNSQRCVPINIHIMCLGAYFELCMDMVAYISRKILATSVLFCSTQQAEVCSTH